MPTLWVYFINKEYIFMANSSQEALAQLQAQQAANKSAGDYLSSAETTLGVGDARNTVKGLRTSIDNTTKLLNQVAPSVMGRTQGSLVTNAQATRQIGNEQAPISKNLTTLGGQYTEAGSNLSDLQSRATQQAQMGYQSQQEKNSYLQNLYNTLYKQEQDQIAQQQAEAARQEQIRQYNASMAEQQRQANMTNSRAASSATSSTPSTMEQALNQLGSSFKQVGKNTARFYTGKDTYMTREQAAYSLANAAGVPYADALKAIYGRFKTQEGK